MRRVLLLAACSALVLPAAAQDGFASLPRDPALAYTAHPDDFRELLPYTVPVDDERGEVRLRAHALRYTWQPPETVEIQADLYEESDRWEGSAATPSTYITMTVGLGEAPPPPEDAKQVRVGRYEGRLGRERGDAVLWVMPAPRRWVRTTHLDTTAGPLVAAVEAVGLDALAALPAETSVWADPLTRTVYQTLFDYWTAHPALVWGRQATPAAVVQAFPEAPLGTYRVIGEASFEDRAPRWSASAGGARVAVDRPAAVVPTVAAEACYYDGPPPPPLDALPLEAAARALSAGGLPAPAPDTAFACLTLLALDPAGSHEDYFAESERAAAKLSGDGWAWSRLYALLGPDAPRHLDSRTLWGHPGYQVPDGDEVFGQLVLGPQAALSFRYARGREADAEALAARIALRVLEDDPGERVPYAVRPYSYASTRDVDSPDTTFATAESYSYRPAVGVVGVERGEVALYGEVDGGRGIRLQVPVQDGWAVWDAPGSLCPSLTFAASPSAPLRPCAAEVPEPGALHLHAGPLDRRRSPLAVLRTFREGSGVYLFGTLLLSGSSAPACRAEPFAVPGALAALRLSCDLAELALPPPLGGYADALLAGSSGARAHVIRAAVLELEGVGPYAVFVVGAEGQGETAGALLDRTVRGINVKGPF